MTSTSHDAVSPTTNIEDVNEEDNSNAGAETSDEIALLEAQLEIARIEARILQLKKSKGKSSKGNNSDTSSSSSASTLTPTSSFLLSSQSDD
jgi:uncharacterized small protein (DUF1192 family)